MSIADQYRQQFGWRDWNTILNALPAVTDATVLDLGCAVGDLAAEFASRGARVIGMDGDEELLDVARQRVIPNAEFRTADLRSLAPLDVEVDGVWASFVAAYFPDLAAVLPAWTHTLKPGGWIALTEVDAMFSHGPVQVRTQDLLDAHVADSWTAGRYDFCSGRKLRSHLEASGLIVQQEFTVRDRELAFDGPAEPAVVEAWRMRLERMQVLRDFCGDEMTMVETEFLSCLTRPDHRTKARVFCCIAQKPTE